MPLPLVLSLAFTLSTLTLITQWAHPFVRLAAAGPNLTANSYSAQELGVLTIVLQAGILMGLILLAVRRWQFTPGSLSLILTLNIVLLSFMRDQYVLIPAALLTGVAADLLLWRLRPGPARPAALRFFAFAVPTILYLFYCLALQLVHGIWWSIHLWLGATALAGVVRWLLSYLVVPPAMPAEE